MALRAVGTRRDWDKPAIRIQVDGLEIALSHAETRGKAIQGLLTALAARARDAGVDLPLVAIHRNAGGGLAIATGIPPGLVLWPEEERRIARLKRQGYL